MVYYEKKRGRPSLASLSVGSEVKAVERIKPPFDLSDEETEVWSNVINSFPTDWFSDATSPLLAQYCRHVIHARRIAEILAKSVEDPEFSIRSYNTLLKMQDRESKAIAGLATKMRISQQSTTNHRGNAKQTTLKPWE